MSRSAQPPAISSASRELIDSVLDAVVQAVQAVHMLSGRFVSWYVHFVIVMHGGANGVLRG